MTYQSIWRFTWYSLGAVWCLSGCVPPGASTVSVRPDPVDQRPTELSPHRASSTTMKVWLAAWEDQRGDLHAPAIVYVEVDPTRWSYGDQATSSRYTVHDRSSIATENQP